MRSLDLGSVCVLFLLLLWEPACGESSGVNPCCYLPCQNQGVCVRYAEDKYECDCTLTGFYGENCTIPEFWTRVHQFLRPSPGAVHFILTHFSWIWDIVNSTSLRNTLMRLVLRVRSNLIPSPPTYNSKYSYLSWESYYNVSYYTRLLPPVPEDCPTPLGVRGVGLVLSRAATVGQPDLHVLEVDETRAPGGNLSGCLQCSCDSLKQCSVSRDYQSVFQSVVSCTGGAGLPDPEQLVERLLKRRTFRPDPQGANIMFAFFAQHFTHQFFKSFNRMGLGFTRALGHGVDAGHIYGDNLERQLQLRLHKDGKLKYQLIDGEIYPPTIVDAPVKMTYPPTTPLEQQLSFGHEHFGLLPGLGMYATLWLREHNRVCDILKAVHPHWDDEQLFQTARLIIIGETIRIVIEEYVQQLSGYHMKLKFDPTMLHHSDFQYSNRIALEFDHLYHWHPLMPDALIINGDTLTYQQFLFNTSVITHYGIEKLVGAFSKQPAGQIGGGHNLHAAVAYVAVKTIEASRLLRVQPFNEYRKRFNLKPYKTFREFSDDEDIVHQLEELYHGDVNALEFYPGLLLEKTRPGAIFGESMVEMGAPFSLKGLLGNPICSPLYWKPSTFGGEVGFDIVNSATLKKLVCLNTKTCPYVAFRVPTQAELEEDNRKTKNEL